MSSRKCVVGCRNNRIKSRGIIHCDSLLIKQEFCVSALVGASVGSEQTLLQTDTTIFAVPNDPIHSARLLSVIARNVSENSVDVRIFGINPDIPLVQDTVGAKSEVALAAPNALSLIASAATPSRVLFFITVFLPTDPIFLGDPI